MPNTFSMYNRIVWLLLLLVLVRRKSDRSPNGECFIRPLNKTTLGPGLLGFINQMVLLTGFRHEACVWRNKSGPTRSELNKTIDFINRGFMKRWLLYSDRCFNDGYPKAVPSQSYLTRETFSKKSLCKNEYLYRKWTIGVNGDWPSSHSLLRTQRPWTPRNAGWFSATLSTKFTRVYINSCTWIL